MPTKRQDDNFELFISAIAAMPPEKWDFTRIHHVTPCGTTCCSFGLLPEIWPELFRYEPQRGESGVYGVVPKNWVQPADGVAWEERMAAITKACEQLGTLIGIPHQVLEDVLLDDESAVSDIVPLQYVTKELVIARLRYERILATALESVENNDEDDE